MSPQAVWWNVIIVARKKEYKDLKSHCKHVHNKPLRQNGQLTIYETFFYNFDFNIK